jgi:hypothetical protein
MNYALICVKGLDCELRNQGIISGDYLRGPSGTVYESGYWTEGRLIPDSSTHMNIHVSQLTSELVSQIPHLGKGIAIAGVTDPLQLMESLEMVRCNADGSELISE